MSSALLTFRYSLAYATSFSVIALSITFFPIYCEAIGQEKGKMALISALSNLGLIFGAPLLSSLAYRRLGPRRVLVWTAFMATLAAVPLFWIRNTVPLYICFFVVTTTS